MNHGRWDVYYVPRPRGHRGGYFDPIDEGYLLAIKDQNPDAWRALVEMINGIDRRE